MFKRIDPIPEKAAKRPRRNDIVATAHATGLARSLRRRMSPPEVALWTKLRGNRLLGLRFRRQHPIGRYIADFCCLELGLIVEVDGCGHFKRESRRVHDAVRNEWMASQGMHILRISALEIGNLPRAVGVIRRECERILAVRKPAEPPPSCIAKPRTTPPPLAAGEDFRGDVPF